MVWTDFCAFVCIRKRRQHPVRLHEGHFQAASESQVWGSTKSICKLNPHTWWFNYQCWGFEIQESHLPFLSVFIKYSAIDFCFITALWIESMIILLRLDPSMLTSFSCCSTVYTNHAERCSVVLPETYKPAGLFFFLSTKRISLHIVEPSNYLRHGGFLSQLISRHCCSLIPFFFTLSIPLNWCLSVRFCWVVSAASKWAAQWRSRVCQRRLFQRGLSSIPMLWFSSFYLCVCVCVCVCVTMKKSARRMASTTSDTGDTSSKQQQAQRKENYNKRKRPVSSVDVCVFVCVHVCVCVTIKKSARQMASTTSDTGDTSSKQQQAQRKENYKRKRPFSSVDHCHPCRRKKRREAVY